MEDLYKLDRTNLVKLIDPNTKECLSPTYESVTGHPPPPGKPNTLFVHAILLYGIGTHDWTDDVIEDAGRSFHGKELGG